MLGGGVAKNTQNYTKIFVILHYTLNPLKLLKYKLQV